MFTLLRRLRARLKYRHFERDLTREIEVHRAMKQDELEASGVRPSDARSTSVRELGNVTYVREEARSIWISRRFDELRQDLRYAARGLRRQPGFSAGVVLILAIGVGSLTTAYSTLNATMLRPWQVPEPESMVIVRPRPAPQQQFGVLSIDEALYLNAHTRTLTGLTTFIRGGEQIDDAGPHVQSKFVTSNFFDVMGVRVSLGPGFTQARDHDRSIREVVISERLWRDSFGGDPAVVGRTVRLSSGPFTIVGVAEKDFEDVDNARISLWTSLAALNFGGSGSPGGAVVGRLTTGVTRGQALAELEGLSRRFREAQGMPAFGLTLTDTRPISAGRPQMLQQFALVFAGLGLILLLTCANVGSLLLARSLARQREVAVRLSLGASRWRVARQFLTETLVLSLGAGAMGVAMAAAWSKVVIAMSGSPLRSDYLAPDWTVVGFAVAASMLAAGLAGFSAARRVQRVSLSQVTAQRHGPDREARVARGLLLVTQVAVTAVFLTGASLVGRSVVVAGAADPGFAVDDISVVAVEFKDQIPAARRSAFTRAMADAVQTARRTDIAFAAFRPLIKGASTIIRVHLPDEHESLARHITHRPVSANYFSLMRIPLVEGRAPAPASEGLELVVSEMAARGLWPSGGAVGRTLTRLGSKTPVTVTVVGVARDTPITSVGQFEPVAYSHSSSLPLALVSTSAPDALEHLRSLSRALEPSAVLVATPLRQVVRESFSEAENASRVGWLVGAAALSISTLGIFGVFSYGVEERRREIGIRIALGGRALHVGMHVLRSGQRAAALGLVIGFALCMIAASLLRDRLYGLQPFDALTYVQVSAILGAATLLALWIPARRAARVDPAITLRHD